MGAVGEHSDVDDLVFDAGAAAVVAGGAEAEPVVAGQPREEQAQPAVCLHIEPDRAVAVLPTQEAAAVGMPLRGLAQVLAEQAAVLNVSAADERPTVAFARERPVARNGSNSVPKILLLVVDLVPTEKFHELLLKDFGLVLLALLLDVVADSGEDSIC